MEITQDWLKKTYTYDPTTGEFRNRISRGYQAKKGELTGWIETQGYRCTKIKGQQYKIHRLVWLYMTGDWPENEIDHINHDKLDNRWKNLRDVTRLENAQNILRNGFTWSDQYQAYIAYINCNKKLIKLGFYDCPIDARAAHLRAKKKYHKTFVMPKALSDRATG